MMQSRPESADKNSARALAVRARVAQPAKNELSRQILARGAALAEFTAARTVMCYVDAGSEVRTRPDLPGMLASGKKLVVPYCEGDDLRLFHLKEIQELSPGAFQIPEPHRELRTLADRQVRAEELDLIFVPGVAFDRRGGRLGRGRGFYDRFLQQVRPDASLIGLAFECQVLDEIPVAEHDILMDKIVTECSIYRGQGRGRCGR